MFSAHKLFVEYSYWRSRDAQYVMGLSEHCLSAISVEHSARIAPQGYGSRCSRTQRPLHTSIEGNRVKRGQAAGCLFLWYLSFGQAKERYLLPVSHRFCRPSENGHLLRLIVIPHIFNRLVNTKS